MEAFKMAAGYFMLFIGSFPPSEACRGNTNSTSGIIVSPNFGPDNGTASNCTWLFEGINSGRGLNLSLIFINMQFYDDIDDKCNTLVINGEIIDCSQQISPQHPKRFFFYNDPLCESIQCDGACMKTKINSSSIKIEYFVKSSMSTDTKSKGMWGFQMKYQYTECPKDSTEIVIALLFVLLIIIMGEAYLLFAIIRHAMAQKRRRRQSLQTQRQNKRVMDRSKADGQVNGQSNVILIASQTDSHQTNDSSGSPPIDISESEEDYVMRPTQYVHNVG